jgi:hypothetical protein
MEDHQWELLNAKHPLALSWRCVSIGLHACNALKDIMETAEESPLFEMLDNAPDGILLVAPPGGGAGGLMLVYEETSEIDPFSFSTDDRPSVVHPGWRVSCELI